MRYSEGLDEFRFFFKYVMCFVCCHPPNLAERGIKTLSYHGGTLFFFQRSPPTFEFTPGGSFFAKKKCRFFQGALELVLLVFPIPQKLLVEVENSDRATLSDRLTVSAHETSILQHRKLLADLVRASASRPRDAAERE